MKNVTLLRGFKNKKPTWRLIGPDGHPVDAFNIFADHLLKRDYSINTLNNYCNRTGHFFDYLYEATAIYQDRLTRSGLADIIESWVEYLTVGPNAGSEIAAKIAQTLPSPMTTASSANQYIAALRLFLKLSEKVRATALELCRAGIIKENIDDQKLFQRLGASRELSLSEKQALHGKSMIAGVVAGGPKLIDDCGIDGIKVVADYNPERCFPYDKAIPFLESLRTFRDKAYYAGLLACGCRGCELRQLLWEDVDFGKADAEGNVTEEASIVLVNPKMRINHPSYMALTPSERKKLTWKGRRHKSTLLIEPFSTLFFQYLAEYLKLEYIPHGKHDFVFQSLHHTKKGEPFFLVSHTARQNTFNRAKKKSGIYSDLITGHSMRHLYATYCLNYFPNPSGGEPGLKLTWVAKLLGHSSTTHTEKYAHEDEEVKRLRLAYVHTLIYQGHTLKSWTELKRDALLARLAIVENEMEKLESRNSD